MTGTNNPIELLVGIKANTKGSEKSIQNDLDLLSTQLEGLKLDLKIDDTALKNLGKLAKVDFSKLLKGLDEVKKQTEGLNQISPKDAENAINRFADSVGASFGKASEIVKTDATKLKQALEGLNAAVTVDYDKNNQITGLVSTIEKDGIKSVTRFKQAIVGLGEGKDNIQWMPDTLRQTDSSFKTVYQSTAKFNEQLNKLFREGKITQEQFKALNTEVDKLGKSNSTKGLEDELTKINRKTAEYVHTNKELAVAQKKAAAEKKKDDAEQATNIQKLIKLESDLIAARKRQPNEIGKNPEAASIEAEIKRISSSSKIAGEDVQGLENRFKTMRAEATEAGRSSMGMAESFKTAMEKFPVWMAASTVFYQTVRSIKDAFDQIIALDSQMTTLKRVAGDGADVNKIMSESVRLAGELGNEIADINEGFIAFARQGFRGDDLTKMAEYATLLGNISDLSIDDASSVLTAGIKGFNIEAENSLRIVDALNEVDNNYSVTTQILAEALMRSAGAAQTYGITLEENIGYTTAIGQVTRESGSVIGNSLKSIYSRITSIQPAIDAMAEIGINIKESGGEMRDVSDIIDDLGGKWQTLSAEQQQNLGLQIAGKQTCQPIQKWIVKNVLNSGELWGQTTVSEILI